MSSIINQIIDAISVAISEEFGDTYNIYDEQIDQELEEPCFYIHLLNDDFNQFLNIRYFRQNHFDIQYFPGSTAFQRECNEVSERLYSCLEYITLYDEDEEDYEAKPIRGGEMHSNVIDGVLHFMVDYNGFMIEETSDDEMEELTNDVSVNDE